MKPFPLTPSIGLLILLPSISSAALYTSGHADLIGIGYEDGSFEPHIHAEGATIDGAFVDEGEYAPNEITTVVPQSSFDFWTANGGRPAGSAWDPIGIAAGEAFWFLSQSNSGPAGSASLGAPFAGIGTEELNPSDWATDITISLDSVVGPGDFSMYLDGFAPSFFMSTADGIDGSDLIVIAPDSHEHFNWAFTAPGTYDVSVSFAGTHQVDGPKSASATFQFQVVPEPSVALLGALGSLALLRRRR
ncbi:choice-of-anchor M domain-containing protein [Haloferula chungangensis]|uniref:Choice-of-anchor M domain-containing protein n=1 Tax=Haloferula chungangensis TaxID=1048331 RepID=A0ABW2LDC4_9BACT